LGPDVVPEPDALEEIVEAALDDALLAVGDFFGAADLADERADAAGRFRLVADADIDPAVLGSGAMPTAIVRFLDVAQ
jgi:hypothetical protein